MLLAGCCPRNSAVLKLTRFRLVLSMTSLYLSVMNNKQKTFKVLLKAGANLNIADNKGWTPLKKSVDDNRQTMFSQLLKAKADANLVNKDGWTPLHFTVNYSGKPKHDYDEFARQLLGAGVAINKKTNAGDSALMLAAYNGKPKVAQLLINRGADTSLVNWEDGRKSALDYAVQKGNYSIADMLRSANAVSGVEQAKYPSRPAAKSGYTSCNNGDCYRTYSDGRKVRFQAQQKFNPFNSQWEFDSGSC